MQSEHQEWTGQTEVSSRQAYNSEYQPYFEEWKPPSSIELGFRNWTLYYIAPQTMFSESAGDHFLRSN